MKADEIPLYMPVMGNREAPIVVICDEPSQELWHQNKPAGGRSFQLFVEYANKYGFGEIDFCFVSPCGPVPDAVQGSDKREKLHIDKYRDSLRRTLDTLPNKQCYVYLGKAAGYALTAKPVKIMKQRGAPRFLDSLSMPVLPLLSPRHVLRRPELREIFESDMNMLGLVVDQNYNVAGLASNVEELQYEWRTDLSDILANKPRMMAVDAESTGLDWYKPEVFPFMWQFSTEPGKAILVPLSKLYFPEHFGNMSDRQYARLRAQSKTLLEDPAIKKCGHNLKIDHHFFRSVGINVRGWQLDSMQLAFVVDENMQEKSLDEVVRRWVPEMAGYADAFNQSTDKSNMIAVHPDKMLPYGGGDVDGCLRATKVLVNLAKKDQRQWKTYVHVQWPALRAFMDVVEPAGINIDTRALADLQAALAIQTRTEYAELIQLVPDAIKRKHLAEMKRGQTPEDILAFSRDSFVRDILFTPEGYGLVPKVFTKSTQKLGKEEQIPSVSTKMHLPFFDDNEFVQKLIKFQKLSKLQNTYVGEPGHYYQNARGDEVWAEPTGFWKYIHEGKIHPSFFLHRTVTGRTASANPNAQNFPKRGELAKAYRKIFVPTEGYVFIEADLSQAELRIAAWMANEPAMLKVYQEGGDIHEATAAGVMGLSIEEFRGLPEEVREKKRQDAKAVNFGFLYGMGWRKFLNFAKTDYGILFTEAEAQRIRTMFFRTYRRLEGWHAAMKDFVKEHGYVRALHGGLRRLPNIRSVDDAIRSECERQAVNSPVQRFASDLGIMSVGRLCRDADPDLLRPVAFIHDAIVVECRREYLEQGAAAVKFYMESNPLENWFGIRPPLPIVADAAWGENLSVMNKMKTIQAAAPEWWNWEADGFVEAPQEFVYQEAA